MFHKAENSLKMLKDGNARFVAGRSLHSHQDARRVKEVAPKQHPFAIVISCSDSRVPPEIVFDQGIGDLFVVRVAGNVLDDVCIGSIEYAAEHLDVPLAVVMGHSRCGAVAATVKGGKTSGYIGSIVEAILPAVEEAKETCCGCDLVEAAAHINVERAVYMLERSSPILTKLMREGKFSVIGAYYDLESGKVKFMER